jgi:hypothetical protein
MKHKKLLAILLSLAIMVTFMPMMAFAATTTGSWSSDGSSYTVTDGTNTKTLTNVQKVWNNGEIEVTLDSTGLDPQTFTELDTYAYNNAGTFSYYDLSNAFISNAAKNGYTTVAYETFMNGATYNKETGVLTGGIEKVWLKQPAYTKDYTAATAATVELNDARVATTITVGGFTEDSYEEQPITLTANVVPAGSGSTTANVNLVGTVPQANLTVQGKKGAAAQMTFEIDSLTKPYGTLNVASGTGTAQYNGETHKVVNSTVKGYSVAYQTQDAKTKAWSDVEFVEFKDKGTYTYRYQVYKSTEKPGNTWAYVTITVTAAANYHYTFEKTVFSESASASANYPQVPKDANPADYVITTGVADADVDEALAVFTDLYDVKTVPFKGNENLVTWTLSQKNLTSAEKEAIYKAHKTFFDNYGFNADVDVRLHNASGQSRTTISTAVELKADAPVVVADKDDDITFSGVTTKAFKAKKKTKKLAKTKSFQIEAVADSGNEIKFSATTPDSKIKVSADGKVTVKKGLKKGTYKFTVKAKTAAGNGYKAAKETNVYVIKIK